MGLFSKKDPCPICGGVVKGLFPTKVEGQAICKECSKNIDLPEMGGKILLSNYGRADGDTGAFRPYEIAVYQL